MGGDNSADDSDDPDYREVLPITGNLVIDYGPSGESSVTSSEVGTPIIKNATEGIIELPINAELEEGDTIILHYTTSPQETALVSIAGDSSDFDVVLIEDREGPSGEYLSTVEVAESVVLNLGTDDTLGLIHEQHAVPGGLTGFVEFEDEDIAKRYTDAGATTEVAGEITTGSFYGRVANPPIRDRNADNTVDENDVDSEEGNISIRAVTDAITGIVQFTINSGSLRVNDDLEITYIGSESFYVKVGRWPIKGIPDLDGAGADALIATSAIVAGTDAQLDRMITIPPATSDNETGGIDARTASTVFELLGVVDGGPNDDCEDCRIKLAVVTGPGGTRTPKEDPVELDPRISVLGVTYQGSQRISVPDRLGVDDTFTVSFDEIPVNVAGSAVDSDGNPIVDGNDIKIVGVGGNLDPGTAVNSVVTVIGPSDGRSVTFQLGDTVVSVFTGSDDETDSAYIEVAYGINAGGNPRNALVPSADDRPIIAVSAGSRLSITSDDNRLTVDAEGDPPEFANPSPAVGGATPDEEQVISVDITDDLAGVDTEEVKLYVAVGTGAHVVVDDSNEDLNFEDIGGGYRVSIALDDIRTSNDRPLNIDPDRTPTISWYAEAIDNANNKSRSDADGDDGDNDDYTFTVDGESTEIDRVFTGDWFNPAGGDDGQVEGDRRLGVDEYLPGASKNTSIRVVFKEAIDGSTVEASDFTVDGDEPLTAEWYEEGDTGDEDDPIARSVFLTVPEMDADETPVLRIVGSVSDMANNATISGSETASDGIAPSPDVIVDRTLSDGKVTVTVETDERIRTLSPDLELFISDALDEGRSALDEVDEFTVGCEDAENDDSDGEQTALRTQAQGGNTPGQNDDCSLVLRDGNGDIVGKVGALDPDDQIDLAVSEAPILDEDGDGDLTVDDVSVDTKFSYHSNKSAVFGGTSDPDEDNYDAADGTVTVTIIDRESSDIGLLWGDVIRITYRGTGPDPARGLPGVPNPTGSQTSSTSWTFELDIKRADTFAARATVEDAARNRGRGGAPDPRASGATVFEIDNDLNDDEPATTEPLHDPSGNNAVSISEPFFIELNWENEAKEYPGDSSNGVTLTKAELDGDDVLASAQPQDSNSYRVSIVGITLGEHTLKYNAEDAVGNTNQTDRTLTFTVNPVPTWPLRLNAGMNLVSLPSDPANGDVNAIFGDTSQINLIFTFEGSQSKVALRNQDNPSEFVGTLDNIDSQHAYWISTSNSATVEVDIPPTSQLAPPPYIAVKGGQWNLVPVISLGAVDDDTPGIGAEPGTLVDADAYLGDFRTAFGWSGRSWIKIDPDGETTPDFNRLTDDITDNDDEEGLDPGDTPMRVGMGYWVLYNEDSLITP